MPKSKKLSFSFLCFVVVNVLVTSEYSMPLVYSAFDFYENKRYAKNITHYKKGGLNTGLVMGMHQSALIVTNTFTRRGSCPTKHKTIKTLLSNLLKSHTLLYRVHKTAPMSRYRLNNHLSVANALL